LDLAQEATSAKKHREHIKLILTSVSLPGAIFNKQLKQEINKSDTNTLAYVQLFPMKVNLLAISHQNVHKA